MRREKSLCARWQKRLESTPARSPARGRPPAGSGPGRRGLGPSSRPVDPAPTSPAPTRRPPPRPRPRCAHSVGRCRRAAHQGPLASAGMLVGETEAGVCSRSFLSSQLDLPQSPPPSASTYTQNNTEQLEGTGRKGGGEKRARSEQAASSATLKMAPRPRQGPAEAVPAHAQRGVPARDTRWRQRRWGGRGGGGKTGGRAERVVASLRVRSGQVSAPGSHGAAASRVKVRGSEAARRWPLRRSPLGATACRFCCRRHLRPAGGRLGRWPG